MVRTLVLTCVVAGAFAAALLSFEGWRVEPVGGEHIPPAQNAPYSAAECAAACKAATIPLQGVRASMTEVEFGRIATVQYGAESAQDLQQAMRESRLLLLDGNLFLPTRELCRQPQLTGNCAAACKRYNLRVP